MDRATRVDWLPTDFPGLLYGQAELVEDVVDLQKLDCAVDDHAKCSILIVLADESDRAREIRVLELRHRHKKLVSETLKPCGAHSMFDSVCFTA